MRRNPAGVAWAVLLVAFGIFCALAVGIPLAVQRYIRYSEREQKALVESISGTVVVEPLVGAGPAPLSRGQSQYVEMGAVVRVDEASEAVVTFADNSSLRLAPGGGIRIDRHTSGRFRATRQPSRITLTLLQGRVRVDTASVESEPPLVFRIEATQARVLLDDDGSYVLDTDPERLEVLVYRGAAWLSGRGWEQGLASRQRTEVRTGLPASPPSDVARNIIVNSELNPPLVGWRVFNDQGNDGGTVDGQVEYVFDEGRTAVQLLRTGAHGNHCETILEQTIDEVLPDPLTSLVVRATVKVRDQALSGGGYLASEYPLMIRITYRDRYDSESEWIQGFYYQNASGNPTTNGLQIPRNRWYLYESGNLVDRLPIQPARIMRLRVYASGWDYDSLVSDISVIVE